MSKMSKEKYFDFMMAFSKYRKLKRKLKRVQDERDENADKLMTQLSINKKISIENGKLKKEIRDLKFNKNNLSNKDLREMQKLFPELPK